MGGLVRIESVWVGRFGGGAWDARGKGFRSSARLARAGKGRETGQTGRGAGAGEHAERQLQRCQPGGSHAVPSAAHLVVPGSVRFVAHRVGKQERLQAQSGQQQGQEGGALPRAAHKGSGSPAAGLRTLATTQAAQPTFVAIRGTLDAVFLPPFYCCLKPFCEAKSKGPPARSQPCAAGLVMRRGPPRSPHRTQQSCRCCAKK